MDQKISSSSTALTTSGLTRSVKVFLFGSGRPFEATGYEAIADDIVAQSRHLKVGDQITLLGHSFTICGIVAHGKGARFFIPLKRAQDISGAEKRVSVFMCEAKAIRKQQPERKFSSWSRAIACVPLRNT